MEMAKRSQVFQIPENIVALLDHQKHCCFGRSLSASCFGAEFLLEVRAQELQGAVGAKSRIAGTGRGQAAAAAPGDSGHVGRATGKIHKIRCREEGGLLGDGQRLGVLEKLPGGSFPLPLSRGGAGFCCRGDLGFVFSHESLCFDFPWGIHLWTLLCISHLQLHLMAQ